MKPFQGPRAARRDLDINFFFRMSQTVFLAALLLSLGYNTTQVEVGLGGFLSFHIEHLSTA